MLCSALFVNKGIKRINIENNKIKDPFLKSLLAMLINKKDLEEIKYTVSTKENLEKRAEFNRYKKEGKSVKEIEDILHHADHGHHELSCA